MSPQPSSQSSDLYFLASLLCISPESDEFLRIPSREFMTSYHDGNYGSVRLCPAQPGAVRRKKYSYTPELLVLVARAWCLHINVKAVIVAKLVPLAFFHIFVSSRCHHLSHSHGWIDYNCSWFKSVFSQNNNSKITKCPSVSHKSKP